MAPGPTSGEVRTRRWGHYRDVSRRKTGCAGVLMSRAGAAQGASTTSRTWPQATVASGLRRSGPPEWTWSDRGERSPPERATGVDLSDRGAQSPPELAAGVDLSDRGEWSLPERATGVDLSCCH